MPSALDVRSSAFDNNHAIPKLYTCDGSQLSPPLSWSKVPTGTKTIAIVADDPDAPKGTFTHWVVTNLPPTTMSLEAGTALPRGAVASKNDKGQAGYTGPCPPSGNHHYEFRVYALDRALPAGVSRERLQDMASGHILATGEVVGMYARQKG